MLAVGTEDSLTFTPAVLDFIGKLLVRPVYDVLALTDFLGMQGATVVNLSFDLRKRFLGLCGTCPVGFNSGTSEFQQIFAKYPNTLFVNAAGNAGGSVNDYTPANLGSMANVLTVGATDLNDNRLNTIAPNGEQVESSSGTAIGLAAPGQVWAPIVAYPGWGFGIGTSYSAPLVTGSAAIIRSLRPEVKPSQVKDILNTSGDNIADQLISGKAPQYLPRCAKGDRRSCTAAFIPFQQCRYSVQRVLTALHRSFQLV